MMKFFAATIIWVLLSSISAGYSDGDGTSGNPYQIADVNDLLELAADTGNYNKCFIMTADIDLEGEIFTSAVIAPDTIKDELLDFNGDAFTGVFDGTGHKILNLVIEAQNADYLGLFGQIGTNGIVKNLRLENCSVSEALASNYVGALAGYNNGGFVMQCSAAMTVYSSCDATGGLVGQNTGSITRCCSTGQVHGNIQVGGLVGCNTGAVGNCYSTCDVSGVPCGTLTQITGNEYKYGAGGLVGYNKGGLIEKSHSTGSVTGCYIGGLVGSSGYYGESIIWQLDWICDDQGNCWQDYIPIPTSAFINSEDWVQNSFWDMGSSGCSFSAGGSPMSGNIDQYFAAWWDFAVETLNGTNDIWVMFHGQYPQFAWQCPIDGDIALPYGVGIDDLQKFARHWLQTGCPNECEGADLSGDGLVDLFDFSILAGHWQQTTLLGTTVAVPDLSGLTYEDAVALLVAAGLQAGYWGTSYSETVPNEHIISQNPVAGSIVYPNTAVDIVVSQGSNSVVVPDVLGMSQSDAVMLLQTVQLMAAVTYSYSDTVEANYVISQNPVAGTKSYYDCTVNLVVSIGPSITIPDVVGMLMDEAMNVISGAGITNLTISYVYSATVAKDYVISQDPASGTVVTQNFSMQIDVSKGPAYSGGTGTPEDPYRISTPHDLMSFYRDGSSCFVLMNDIDMNGILWTRSYGMESFSGTFEGNGHKICNLTYTDSGYSAYIGLFGSTDHATIKNLTLENLVISLNGPNVQYLGGMAGYMIAGTVSNCHIIGTISGTGSNNDCIGGLVGYMTEGIISHCSFTGSVIETGTGSELIGGLIGQIYIQGAIEHCTSAVQVRGEKYIGGIAGYLRYYCNIQNCTSTGSVVGSGEDCGGLAGYQYDNCNIRYCTSSCSVSGTKNLGGLVGYQSYSSVSNSFSSGNVTGTDSLGGLVGYLYYGYISNSLSTGTVSGGDYLGGLLGSQDPVSTIYNCSSTGNVSGLKYLGGLIGRQYSQGVVKNSCSTGQVTGNDYLGGLIGYQSDCRISNCYSTSNLNASSECLYIGGLVGYQSYCSVSNSYSACTMTGGAAGTHIGGLIGDGIGITTNSYWDVETSGQSSGIGSGQQTGVVGKTTSEMKTLATFISAGWDFTNETTHGTDDIWRMCLNGVDYPRLNWESIDGDFACPDGVSTEDLDYFVGRWLLNNCTSYNNYCGGVDMDTSGAVNLVDFSIFAQHWLEEM